MQSAFGPLESPGYPLQRVVPAPTRARARARTHAHARGTARHARRRPRGALPAEAGSPANGARVSTNAAPDSRHDARTLQSARMTETPPRGTRAILLCLALLGGCSHANVRL